MTTGHYSRSLLLFGFLVYWGVLRGKCAATISNDLLNATTEAASNSSAIGAFLTQHHDPSVVSFKDADAEESETTKDSLPANAPRRAQRPRSRLAGGSSRSLTSSAGNASEWQHNDTNRVDSPEATPERISRGKKKFVYSGQTVGSHELSSPSVPKLSDNAVPRSFEFEKVPPDIQSPYPQQRRGDAGYDRYSIGNTDDDIDSIRNFNMAAGTRKVDIVHVVKKPHGFLSPPPLHSSPTSAKHDQPSVPANSAPYTHSGENPSGVSSPSLFFVPPKKRANSNDSTVSRPPHVALHPKIAVDAPPVGFNVGDLDVPANKNEIWKKPPSKLVASSSSAATISPAYPKRTHNIIGPEENGGKSSLPTTSTAWALASMRTTDTAGPKQWRHPIPVVSSSPSSLLKKNGHAGREPSAFDSEKGSSIAGGTGSGSSSNLAVGVKPFVSWSTRLQKTTTEPAKDLTLTSTVTTPIDVVNNTPSIAYAEPKLTKIVNTWTASIRGKSDEKTENEGTNIVLKIPSTPNSTHSDTNVATETHFSMVGSQRKANASNDIIQNDVSSVFDREDGVYGADQHPEGRVDFPSSIDATTSRTRSSTVEDVTIKNASSNIGSLTTKVTTLSYANSTTAPESEHRISQAAMNSSDVASDSPLPASDTFYGDEDTQQPSSVTTMATLTLVPVSRTPSNSLSSEHRQDKPTSTITGSDGAIIAASDNLTTLAHPANGSFSNVSRSATDFVSSKSVLTTTAAQPLPDDQPLTNMIMNVFTESINWNSTAPTGHNTTVHASDAIDLTTSLTHDYSSDFLEKEEDFLSDTEATTNSNWSNFTLLSSRTVSSFLTTRLPSSVWPTFTATFTSQPITMTNPISRITTDSTTPVTTTSSTTITPIITSSPPNASTSSATTAQPSSTTTTGPTSTTFKPTPISSTSPTTTIGPSSTSTPPTPTTPITSKATVGPTTASTSRTTAAPTSPKSTALPTSTTAPTTTFRTTTSPTTPTEPSTTIKPKIGANNMPGYLKLVFKTTVADICETSTLKENLIQFITQRSLRVQSKNQVMMMIDPEECREPSHSTRSIPVALYVVDEFGGYDKSLVDEMKSLLEDDTVANNTLAIHEIVFRENVPNTSRVIAAIVITCIAAVCFVLLVFLMCAIRSRQKTNYGQRCTPVSVDDYNLDNISEYNSVRRRGHSRMSRRSYSNPSFDDPVSPSKTLNLLGLTKAVENRAALDAEFTRIPTIAAKADELPAGVEVKNRYANVIPLPETRVSLDPDDRGDDSADDYINANYVKGFEGADKFYIACQGPLASTIQDFWKMIWNEQTKIIIMLTGLTENGVEKCADYLPPSEVLDCHRLFGDYQITLKKREVKEKYVISSLQLKNMETNLWREVTHLWYTNWPAQGVPSEQSSIIAFLIEARAYTRNNKGPIVVHCSPGTGRTGTVIAIDICIRDYESSRTVNVPTTVSAIRRCRAGAVQTKEQYAFIYKVLVLYAKKLNGGTALDSM